MSGIDPDDWARSDYEINCVRAIETTAAKLGMDPATLAANCANGEIGALVEAATYARGRLPGKMWHTLETLDAALQPFTKE